MTRRIACACLAIALGAAGLTGFAAGTNASEAARDTTKRGGAPRDTTSRNGAAHSFVPADSLPSDDARAVLRTIAEPLPPGATTPAATRASADSAASPRDSTAADSSGVPVPEPTAPLGEAPGAPRRTALADSAGLASPSGSASAPKHSAASPDTCWRVQLAAPIERAEAEAKRAAAESQLILPMVIEDEHGRHKVRTRDCLSAVAADALRARALASGFPDAFRIRMTPEGAVRAGDGAAKPAAKVGARTKVRSANARAAGAKPKAATKKQPARSGAR